MVKKKAGVVKKAAKAVKKAVKAVKKPAKPAKKTPSKTTKKPTAKKPSRKAVKVVKKTTKKKAKEEVPTTPLVHTLIPEHRKLNQTEQKQLFETYQAGTKEIPKILITDPAIRHLEVKEGDLIEITRKSPTAGEIKFYRCVMND